jgi:peptidoglycan/LPS O-acetylase OafA/YrhL
MDKNTKIKLSAAGSVSGFLSPMTSFYLDCLRIIAALIVFFGHCVQFWYPEIFPQMPRLSHGAVIVFFVLSGYVIAHSTLSRGSSIKSYVVARLSRLYSVVIPALALTAILQVIGTSKELDVYSHWGRGFDLVRYGLAALFLQNVWALSASPPSNNPFWSLSYEFWYYVLFGVAIFISRRNLRIILLLVVALIIGPNILLLLPCWIAGAILYRARDVYGNKTLARAGFIVSLMLAVFSIVMMPVCPGGLGHKPLLFSGAFLSDWVTAAFVSLNILCLDVAFRTDRPPKEIASLVQGYSRHTFSLYLFHYPIIVFVTGLGIVKSSNPLEMGMVFVGILVLVYVLSLFTEAKRGSWRAVFDRYWNLVPGSNRNWNAVKGEAALERK